MEEREKWARIRIRIVGVFFILAFGLIVARAFHLQVLSREELQARAERQHQKVIPLTPQRGTIYDRNGEELAVSVEVDSIYVNPRRITDPPRQARALAAALDLPLEGVRAKLSSDKNFIWLKRRVTPREGEAVRALGLEGVNFVKEHQRFYPNSEIGAQVIGFTGLDPEGLEGLELKYDHVLLGRGGYLVTERDALGRGMASGDGYVRGGSRGNSLHLTLDRTLQYLAEKELEAGVKKTKARGGTAVVLDPQTGKVLAMASQPSFNPNAFQNHRPGQWRNRAICDTFEPGSTFKVFLLAGALNEGVVGPAQKLYCEKGDFKVGGRVIHDNRPYEHLTVAEILKYSSNIGVAKISKVLDKERFYRYIQDFGFGAPTEMDLPGEVSGLVRPPNRWFEIDQAAIAFGQGISVTPLQLAAATGAIANGGYLMAPYVVERMDDEQGVPVTETGPRLVRKVVSEQTARRLTDMMVGVTEEGGTGTLAQVPGFRVAGKTGTAQKVDPVTGGYSVDKRVGSFIGFVPAEDPRLVIVVNIDEPQGVAYGGLVAAPVFARIASQSLRYLGVSHTAQGFRGTLPDLEEASLSPVPELGPSVAAAGGAGGRMPNFLGMSYRQALRTMETSGVNVRLQGSGRAVEQLPAGGQPIRYGSEVWVRFAPPL